LIANELARLVGAILVEYVELQKKLRQMGKAFPEPCRDIRESVERLQHVPRYLEAANLSSGQAAHAG
jgi:hypothetical protein